MTVDAARAHTAMAEARRFFASIPVHYRGRDHLRETMEALDKLVRRVASLHVDRADKPALLPSPRG